MNNREAFEAWYKNNFGEPDFLRGACGTYYMNSSVDFACQAWQAALAQANVNEQSQAQQPTVQPDVTLLSSAFDLIQEASKELERLNIEVGISRQPLVDELSGIGYALRDFLQSQAQQSQWISVEERLPDGDRFVDVFVKSRNNLAYGTRFTEFRFINGMFDVSSLPSACYVTHWMPLPPAPEGGDK